MSGIIRKMSGKIVNALTRAFFEESEGSKEGFRYNENDPESCRKLVSSSIYAKRCIRDITITAFGRFSHDILKTRDLTRVAKEVLETGNGYFEVVVFMKKVQALYHVGAKTVKIKSERTADGRKQYTQGDEKGAILEEFSPAALETEGKKSFIIQIMNYESDSFFGVPFWLAAKPILEQARNGNLFVSSFYDGNAIPHGILVSKGAEPDDDLLNDVETLLRSKKADVSARRGLLHIHMDEESSLDYLAFNQNIVDNSFIQLSDRQKADIVAMFGVPPKRVGLETVRNLGGEGDYLAQLEGYYNDIIVPFQNDFKEALLPALPDLVFLPPEVNKQEQTLAKFAKLREELLTFE